MLSKFSNSFLKKLALIMNEVSLKPGEFLYREGEIDKHFYFVYSGEMEVFSMQQNGHYTKEVKLCKLDVKSFLYI
jgi:CRP-like cAMP-binding protein